MITFALTEYVSPRDRQLVSVSVCLFGPPSSYITRILKALDVAIALGRSWRTQSGFTGRAGLRAARSSIRERNSVRIGDVFDLL
jgi:hypothetical protein